MPSEVAAIRIRLKYYLTVMLNHVAHHNVSCYIAAMSNNASDSDQALEAVLERIRREAYADGWQACMREIEGKIGELKDRHVMAIGDAFVPAGTAGRGAPKSGSTPWHVLQAITHQAGMTGSEVVEAVVARGQEASEASIRTSLSRLAERKLIVSRHRKWFLATSQKEAEHPR